MWICFDLPSTAAAVARVRLVLSRVVVVEHQSGLPMSSDLAANSLMDYAHLSMSEGLVLLLKY